MKNLKKKSQMLLTVPSRFSNFLVLCKRYTLYCKYCYKYSKYILQLTSEKKRRVSVSRKFKTLSTKSNLVVFVGLSRQTLQRPVKCIWLRIIKSFCDAHSWAIASARGSLSTWKTDPVGVFNFLVSRVTSYWFPLLTTSTFL